MLMRFTTPSMLQTPGEKVEVFLHGKR